LVETLRDNDKTFSHDFGLTNLDLRDILLRTLTALDQTLDDEIKWPNDDEFEGIVSSLSAEVQEEFPDLGAIVDGTEVRIPRPSNYQKQKEYWSKKKHRHSLSLSLNYVGLHSKRTSHLCI
jgi:hypothetical protein